MCSSDLILFMIAIIKNRCIIFTFNIFIYCVILVCELFFLTSHLSTLYFFFPFNYRFFSAIISNVIKKIKIKNTTTMYLFVCFFLIFLLMQDDFFSGLHKGQSIAIWCWLSLVREEVKTCIQSCTTP